MRPIYEINRLADKAKGLELEAASLVKKIDKAKKENTGAIKGCGRKRANKGGNRN